MPHRAAPVGSRCCYHLPVPASIDLNADAGESYGRWQVVDEAALFTHLTSANLACGFHAGDPAGLLASIELAAANRVAIGAHPGLPDLAGFGRRDMALSEKELLAITVYQLGALAGLMRSVGQELHHVKAHGALYNLMTRDRATARVFGAAVAQLDPRLPVVALAGGGGAEMVAGLEESGVRVVLEAFPDRGYAADGRLAPRGSAGALLHDPESIAERAVAMATGAPFAAVDGSELTLECRTLCLHGDGATSVAAAATVRRALEAAGVAVAAF